MARFQTRSRAVEMLGRQQIAGIPTAISELFKNAHDAYADKVEVDFFRSDRLFLLRDDGFGMTKEDFENRWLTLGTESKFEGDFGGANAYIPYGQKPRPIMGEKGIGRLAIAMIGPQVLVLTRAKRDDALHDLVAAFINWELFACPGINLEQIEIPIETFGGGALPTASQIASLVQRALDNLDSLSPSISQKNYSRIVNNLHQFTVDPVETENFLGGLSLAEGGHGTHFYILPTDETLAIDIDSERKQDGERRFTKFLLGFTNTMLPGVKEPPIKTAFRDWKTDEIRDDLIAEGQFFTPDDFAMADHHIKGQFDEYGQFVGTVTVYDESPVEHVISWPKASGVPVLCGPFDISIAYVQGEYRATKLTPENHAYLTKKLDALGGLYVFRDGIRILPYGNHDVDWLNIELRRNKSAKYYYFSYRRLFGAVEITKEHNHSLAEKAGREGFQQNKAYRQLTDILENFFVQIAADFFREGGTKADVFIERRAELDRLERARRKREKQVTAKRKKFADGIENFFSNLQSSLPERELSELYESVDQSLKIASSLNDPDEAASALIDAELDAYRKLEAIKQNYKIVRPKGVGLTKQLSRDWEAYLEEADALENGLFSKAAEQIASTVCVFQSKSAGDSIRIRPPIPFHSGH
ncbi:MAG: ATP-binding protein [Thermodesulfobacteriota bacterium]